MNASLHFSWKKRLENEFQKPYVKALFEFVSTEYQSHRCYPPETKIFSAFDFCSYENLKVVIIGQDPYHGIGQANGLAFSVTDDVIHPPSLKNIFKEIESDLELPYPKSGNLERWAKQGVLLLNATLTVRAHEAGSHQKKGWEDFTNAVIRLINDKHTPVIFLLWGGYAKKKSKLIDQSKHKVLITGHPSPLSANRGYWFGNKHFSKTNSLLERAGSEPISWI